MAKSRKFLAVLMAVVLVLSLLPAQVLALSGSGTLEQGGYLQSEQVYQSAGNVVGDGPQLAEGNYVRWIDRLAELPQWSIDFYQWLERHDDAGGLLSDPTTLTPYNGRYLHQLTTVTNDVDFTYSSGENAADKAVEAIYGDIDINFPAVMDYAVAVYSAYDRDHPEVFWLSGNSRYTWSASYDYDYSGGKGTATYTMKVNFVLMEDGFDLRQQQYTDPDAIADAAQQRDADVERILAACPMEAPADEQVRYLNQVLTETNCYNVSASASVSMAPWKCTSALSGGADGQGPVCEGYARAFKVLCDQLGIGCVLVEGDAISKVGGTPVAHMWNYVQAGDGWYAVDVTWNDPLVEVTGDDVLSGYENEEWLLLGSESMVAEGLTFIQSHPVTNVVTSGGVDFANGPVLSQTEYAQPENYMDMTPYRADGYTAPQKEGHVFAGWYQDIDCTVPVAASKTTGWGYAKFVDQATLTVKFQLTAGTTKESGHTDLRLLTAVDGLQYSQVAFLVTVGDTTQTLPSNTVYEQVRAGESLISGADQVFGGDARFFVTYTLLQVPNGAFDTVFTVVPSWTTLDGTVVEGAARSFTIDNVV